MHARGRARALRVELKDPQGELYGGLNAPPEGNLGITSESTVEVRQEAKSRSKRRPYGSEDRTIGGPSGPVAEVLVAYKDAFALGPSANFTSLIPQPAANALARKAVDRYGLATTLAAISIAPRHRWLSDTFIVNRTIPPLTTILSDKVLSQLVNEVTER